MCCTIKSNVSAIKLIAIVAFAMLPEVVFAQVTYNYPKMLLSVPWMPQVGPGDWDNTKNCGQTCVAMLDGYFKGYSPASSKITAENTWLAKRFKNSLYNDPNGSYTSFSNGTLTALITEYCGLKCNPSTGKTPADVLYQLSLNKPVIVEIRIARVNKMEQMVTSGGTQHWALAVGFDPQTQKIILNDPGSNSGKMVTYPIGDFDKSWALGGRIYSPVAK